MTMITPSYLGDTIEYSSYASNALGALPYGRPAGGREFTSDSFGTSPGSTDQLVVRERTLVGVEVLSGFEREGVVASLGVGELDLVPDFEWAATAGGTGRFGHAPSLPVFPGASFRGGGRRNRIPAAAMAAGSMRRRAQFAL